MKNISMKKALKVLLILTCVAIVGLYLAFLFILPNVIDLNKYKPEIQKLAREQGNVELNIQNLKLVARPDLHLGVRTGDISIMLPDNSTLFNSSDVYVRVSLPQLLLMKVKVFADVTSPALDLDIQDGKQYKIVSHIEDILNKNKGEVVEVKADAQSSSSFPVELIKIFAHVNVTDYKFIINDIKSSHVLSLQGDNLYVGYHNNEKLQIKTDAHLLSDGEGMINANVDINTFLPEVVEAAEEEDEAIKVEIPFVNPVLTYRDYNVRGNVDTKLRIREKDGVIKSWGHFNLENFTANLAGLQLPESYMKVKTRGSKIFSDSNITFAKNQNIKILGALDYLAPNMDLSILSDKIYFNDVIILAKAVLDTLRIKNDFDSIKGEGYFLANAEIKTNFKNLKSNGSFIVNNGKIQSDKRGLVLDRMNVSANLDNNVLSIYDSGAYINGKKLNIKGSIDEKTNTDIAVIIEKLPLPELYKVFAPSDIKKQIDLLSGDLSLNANIKGKLKNAIASMKINVTDFSLTDKAKTFIIKNDDAQVEFLNNFKSGLVTNKNLKIYIPMSNSNIEIPLTSVMLDTQNVTIPLSLLKINDKSNLLFSGEINDYLDDAEINFVASGDLDALDLRRFAGKNFEKFVDAKGKIPVELSVEGDKDKMTLKADLLPNSDNYITPIHFNKVMGADTALKTVVNIRHNRIKIKDTGLYIRKNTVDEEGQTQITFDPVITVDGTIVGDYINKLTIDVPKELDGVIYAFKSSKFKVNPSKLHVFSNLSAPKFKGKLSISDIAIPDLYLTLSKAVADFRETFMHFDVSELILNGSDMHIDGDLSLIPSSVLELSNLNINSSFTDADKIMKVSDAAMNILPPSNSTEPADIPVAIKNGGINFKSIKSGNIILDNTTSKIVMKNNIFYLDDLLTHMCDGMISGKIAMNLVTGFMKIRVNGENLNADKLLYQAAAMKDMLTGTASFKTDISLSGATYQEQMKTLLGTVTFNVKNGQYGPFGKLENMILAENIRESEFFKATIGVILTPLVTIDTTHFTELDGVLSFKDGITTIESINSKGDILALNLFGKFNLLNNIADMKVRSRLASQVSDMLGPIALVNPVNLVKNTPGLNIVLAKSFSLFCEQVTQDELDAIPNFDAAHSDKNATKFQIVLKGDVNKPLTLVKSFKWLATQAEVEKAQGFAEQLVLPEDIPTKKDIKKAVKEEVKKNLLKRILNEKN